MADALEWVVRSMICHYLHVDDFLVANAPSTLECSEALSSLIGYLDWLGFPVASEKFEGPTTKLTFLGIETDNEDLVLRFPQEKLVALKNLISSWRDRHWCIKSELQSLAGKLQHTQKVVRPGRSFLRRIFQLLKSRDPPHPPPHSIELLFVLTWRCGTSSWSTGMGCPCYAQPSSQYLTKNSIQMPLVASVVERYRVLSGSSSSGHIHMQT